jgi:phosphohistidine phosphatase
MRHLYLLRHAKASWKLAGELDYERGLDPEGVTDCELMRAPIAALVPPPQFVLCSGARRTRETLEGVAGALPKSTVIEFDDRIYQAGALQLIDLLHEVDAKYESVMLLGHNPSMHDLAVELARSGPELEAMAGKFPKGALAELTLECGWDELAADCAELTAFTRPKQLRG